MRRSAGLLLYRAGGSGTEVLLGHMGGPYWARRDDGAWSIPKGEYPPGEDPAAAAAREFAEEMGTAPPPGTPVPLGELRVSSGKILVVFALPGEFDVARHRSDTFALEWPPRSGRTQAFPEIDRAGWFGPAAARKKLVRGQVPFLDLLEAVAGNS